MSKIKRISSILAVMLLMGSIAASMWTPAFASGDPPQKPGLFWTNVSTAQAGISASGTTVKPSVSVTGKTTGTKISGTLYLEKQSGRNWVNVTSWSVSGTGNLRTSKSYTGTTGTTYRARFYVTAGVDKIEDTSSSVTI